MHDNKIQDQGVAYLSTVLSQSKELHTFNFDLDTFSGQILSFKSLLQLIDGVMNSKFLSRFSLRAQCQEISFLCTELLISHISNMKSLNDLSLFLQVKNFNPLVRKEFETISQQLQKKFQASISCFPLQD